MRLRAISVPRTCKLLTPHCSNACRQKELQLNAQVEITRQTVLLSAGHHASEQPQRTTHSLP
jgi:hypothetical protein